MIYLLLFILLQQPSEAVVRADLKEITTESLFEKSCGRYLLVSGQKDKMTFSVSVEDAKNFRDGLRSVGYLSTKLPSGPNTSSKVTFPIGMLEFINSSELKPELTISRKKDMSFLATVRGVTFKDFVLCGLIKRID